MEDRNWKNWLPLLLAGFTAFWGYQAFLSQKLTSARPARETWKDVSLVGDQFVPARLWQDPFEAIKNASITNILRQHPSELMRQIISRSNTSHDGVQVIGILTEGHPYPEDQEVRLRFRYAIQMAMTSQDYYPADRNFIGVMSIPWASGNRLSTNLSSVITEAITYAHNLTQATNGAGSALDVPFEWFVSSSTDGKARPTLVLWLREEAFSDLPIGRMRLLLEGYLQDSSNYVEQVSILGPRASDTLKAFLSDTNSFAWPHPPSLFSCQATAPTSLLVAGLGKNANSRLAIKQKLERSGVNFVDCIASDDQLAGILIDELQSRDFKTKGTSSDLIALVTEIDTTYGRSLQDIFSAEFENHVLEWNGRKSGIYETKAKLHQIDYLRGLDGSTVNKPANYPNADTAKAAMGLQALVRGTPEAAQGENQMDYARRLAKRLAAESLLSMQNGHGEIRAIGILGSDVYDKLVLLQALRTEFPNALFFTTDLDARLLEPTANLWVRNLIVASAYSIEADEPSFLSFRDSYQTSLFRACKMALTNATDAPLPKPVLFEIGRTVAVRLPLVGHPTPSSGIKPKLSWWIFRVMMPTSGALLGAFGMLGLLRGVGRGYYNFADRFRIAKPKPEDAPKGSSLINKRHIQIRRFKVLRKLAVFGSIFILAAIVVARWDSTRPTGEPIAWLQGTSVWPTIILRILAVLFCIGSITWAWHTYNAALFDFEERFKLPRKTSPDEKPGRASSCRPKALKWSSWLVERRRFASITNWAQEEFEVPQSNQGAVNAESLFLRYQVLGEIKHRLWRVIPVAVALLFLCGGVLIATGGLPRAPFRGSVSQFCERITLMASIFGIVLLMSYVLDVARLTERLIKQLGSGITLWPEALITETKIKTGLNVPTTDGVVSGILDVQFVADFTARIHVVFYLPFVVLCLLILSRNSYFDRWPWPFGLIFIFLLNFVLAFTCSWCIRSVATKVKSDALDRMTLTRMQQTENVTLRAKIEDAIKFTENIRGGVYSGWLHDPSIVGTLVPTASAGLVAILKAVFGP